LVFTVINLHLLAHAVLWVGENLAGFDTALLAVEMALPANPTYTIALLMLGWLLLAPYFEAANFLLHLDTRTRQEGLDLFYRVQRSFTITTVPKGRVLGLGLFAGLFLGVGGVRADENDPAANRSRPTPEEIKKLLRKQGPAGTHEQTRAGQKKREEARERERREIERDEPKPQPQGGGGGGGVNMPAGGLALGPLGWILLAGLAAAILVVAGLLFLSTRGRPRPQKAPVKAAPEKMAPADLPRPEDHSPTESWRRAETLAAEGRFLDALRHLYLAALFQLDRKQLLHYEATRTNGEYVRQVRLSEHAPPALQAPFERLTNGFEVQWYGERSCDAGEYAAFRRLAEEIRDLAGTA
jgi:hypothetical protein